jgi:hypothetical protein
MRPWEGTISLDTVKAPTAAQLGDIAAELGFTFTDADPMG